MPWLNKTYRKIVKPINHIPTLFLIIGYPPVVVHYRIYICVYFMSVSAEVVSYTLTRDVLPLKL